MWVVVPHPQHSCSTVIREQSSVCAEPTKVYPADYWGTKGRTSCKVQLVLAFKGLQPEKLWCILAGGNLAGFPVLETKLIGSLLIHSHMWRPTWLLRASFCSYEIESNIVSLVHISNVQENDAFCIHSKHSMILNGSIFLEHFVYFSLIILKCKSAT